MAEQAVVAPRDLVAGKSTGLHQIDRLVLGYRGAKALFTAIALDLFTHLADGPLTLKPLSARMKTKERPSEVLLDTLSALGFLSKESHRYANTPLAAEYLVQGAPRYLGDNLRYQDMAWECWGGLETLMRRGKSKTRIWELLDRSPGFARAYIRGMDNIAEVPAREIAGRVTLGAGPRKILDVGAGPGAYTRAILEKHPGASAVLLDLPPSLAVAAEVLRDSPLRPRITLKAGDYHKASFGAAAYDLVLMSHITHNEDEAANKRLVRKGARALRAGGALLIHDFTVQEDGAGPLFAALLSLHMLATTGRGKIYSRGQYSDWMREAGLEAIETWPISSRLENSTWGILGRKP